MDEYISYSCSLIRSQYAGQIDMEDISTIDSEGSIDVAGIGSINFPSSYQDNIFKVLSITVLRTTLMFGTFIGNFRIKIL